jgi:hypothetical protein
VPAVAENVVELEPCGIVTLAGTFAEAGAALIATAAPPLKAADESVTVQVDPADGVSVTGLHERPAKTGVCRMVTVPALADVAIGAPVESADRGFVNWTAAEVSVGEVARFSVTDASTLFGIDEVFSPQTRQVAVPALSLQDSVLPEAPAAAAMVAEVKFAGRVQRQIEHHGSARGCRRGGEAKRNTLRETLSAECR